MKNKNFKKIALLSIFILTLTATLSAQNDTIPPRMKYNINYNMYIAHNRENPRAANGDTFSGEVKFEFLVTERGCIDSIRIISSPHEKLTKETIRVLEKTACKWISGSVNGEPKTLKIKSKVVYTIE